jgi:hypothetical protein
VLLVMYGSMMGAKAYSTYNNYDGLYQTNINVCPAVGLRPTYNRNTAEMIET